MILFWRKEEHEEGACNSKNTPGDHFEAVSLGKMLLHFWLYLRPGFLGMGYLLKVCGTL